MDGDFCPICKSQKYLNPTMTLLVGPCSHKMCESCIDRLFLGGPAPCPICSTILRKANFVSQKFEDLRVEKEIQIRIKLAQTHNKRLEDFKGDLRAYNDYLEEAEDILHNLANSIDYQDTMRKIKDYQLQNRDFTRSTIQKQVYDDRDGTSRIDGDRGSPGVKESQAPGPFNTHNRGSSSESDISFKGRLPSKRQAYSRSYADEHDSALAGGGYPDKHPGNQFKNPIDFLYKPQNLPRMAAVYHDPWITSLKMDESNIAKLLAAGGFEPNLVHYRAIISAFTGLHVGLDRN